MATETAVKERPILFSGEMVRAILDGRKTQTRRVVKPHLKEVGRAFYPGDRYWVGPHPGGGWWAVDVPEGPPEWMIKDQCVRERQGFPCPYGVPGDRLWVREAWAAEESADDFAPCDLGPGAERIWHRADEIQESGNGRWRSSIHMPRWASRILLEITDVRVERVQEISVNDACAEGSPWDERGFRSEHRPWFIDAWNSINAKRGYSWESNPWVWVIEFKVLSISE